MLSYSNEWTYQQNNWRRMFISFHSFIPQKLLHKCNSTQPAYRIKIGIAAVSTTRHDNPRDRKLWKFPAIVSSAENNALNPGIVTNIRFYKLVLPPFRHDILIGAIKIANDLGRRLLWCKKQLNIHFGAIVSSRMHGGMKMWPDKIGIRGILLVRWMACVKV